MNRRGSRYVINILLLIAAVVVSLTGLLVDQLDLNDFAPHRWAGYAVAVLIAIHVGLHWRWFLPSRNSRGQHRGPGAGGSLPDPTSLPSSTTQPGSRQTETAAAAPSSTPLSRRGAIAAVGAGVTGVVVGWWARAGVSPNPYRGGDVGLFYHQQSSLGLGDVAGDVVDWGRRPAPYLKRSVGESVELPPPTTRPDMSVDRALQQRRSLRDYSDRAMTAEELAWVVHAATGITATQGLRTAPSAGGLYPLETYVAVSRVQGIEPGIYHVDVRAAALEPIRSGAVAGDLMLAGLGQDFLRKAPVVLVITGLFQRMRWKYRERHYRYVCWEGGHVTQNVYLAAEAAGLGACMVGAFLDGRVNDLIGVDGQREAALGLIAVGPR